MSYSPQEIQQQIKKRQARIDQIDQHNNNLNRSGDPLQNMSERNQLQSEMRALMGQAKVAAPKKEAYFGQQNEGANMRRPVQGPVARPQTKRTPNVFDDILNKDSQPLVPATRVPAPQLANQAEFIKAFNANRPPTTKQPGDRGFIGPVSTPSTKPSSDLVNSWIKNDNDRFKPQPKPIEDTSLSDPMHFNTMFAEARKRVLAEQASEAPKLKNVGKVLPNANGKGYTTTVLVAGHPREVTFEQVPNQMDIRKVQEKILAQDHPELAAKYLAAKAAKGKIDPGDRVALMGGILNRGEVKGKAESDSTDPGHWANSVNWTWDRFQDYLDHESRKMQLLDKGRQYLADKIHPYAVKAGKSIGGPVGDITTGILDTLNSDGFRYVTDPGSMGREMASGLDEGGFDGYLKFAGAPIKAVLAIDEVTGLPTLAKATTEAVGKGVAKFAPNTFKKIAPTLFPHLGAEKAAEEASELALSRLKSREYITPRPEAPINPLSRKAGQGGKSSVRAGKKIQRDTREWLTRDGERLIRQRELELASQRANNIKEWKHFGKHLLQDASIHGLEKYFHGHHLLNEEEQNYDQ